MGMKFLPLAATLSGVLLLVSCGPKPAVTSDQDQERQLEEKQAREQRELHEREAALDERERVLNERQQQLAVAAAPAPQPPAQQQEQQQPPPPVAAAPAPAVSANTSYQGFFDDLSPYGSWLALPRYGYVWQPTATTQDPRWRPYTLGHWVFTDGGWTWDSDEPFGWITYHYGRWMRTSSLNWVWVPGNVWAPAWVSWRYGNDYVGWAPLPPEAAFNAANGIKQWADGAYGLGASYYTFVPAAEFGDDNMADQAVPPDEDGPIYDDSNNMTNIYYEGGYIVCYGPDYDFMNSRSHRHLPPKLRLALSGFHTNGKNKSVITGNTFQASAPGVVATGAPRNFRGYVAEKRLIIPSSAAYAHSATAPANGAPAAGMRIPSRMNPAPVSPQVQPQNARDLQVIEQQQAARADTEQQTAQQQTAEAERARAAADQQAAQQHALEAERAQRAAEKAAAAEQSAREEREVRQQQQQQVRQVQPSNPASNLQTVGQGRNQQ